MEDILGKMQELLSDPESLKQISELAKMFKSEENQNPPVLSETTQVNPLQNIDSNLLLQAGALLNQSQNDNNTNLLLALRPHLSKERQQKLDKAVKLLKLWRVWKQLQETGMLQNLL